MPAAAEGLDEQRHRDQQYRHQQLGHANHSGYSVAPPVRPWQRLLPGLEQHPPATQRSQRPANKEGPAQVAVDLVAELMAQERNPFLRLQDGPQHHAQPDYGLATVPEIAGIELRADLNDIDGCGANGIGHLIGEAEQLRSVGPAEHRGKSGPAPAQPRPGQEDRLHVECDAGQQYDTDNTQRQRDPESRAYEQHRRDPDRHREQVHDQGQKPGADGDQVTTAPSGRVRPDVFVETAGQAFRAGGGKPMEWAALLARIAAIDVPGAGRAPQREVRIELDPVMALRAHVSPHGLCHGPRRPLTQKKP
jgi:hypothetical protein